MALLRAKWFVMGVPVGFWWGWKKSNVWEMEKLVESVLPAPVARHVVDLLPKGTADARQKVRLHESIRENGRRQEETIRKQEETIRSLKENAARQEQHMRRQEETMTRQEQLLQAVLSRLPEQQGSPPTTTTTTTTTTPPPTTKQ